MDEEIRSEIKEQTKTLLLDSQLNYLAERLFETGKRVDAMLTAWLTFTALTLLLCFGVINAVSIGGLQLRAMVAASVTFGLTCAYYYRLALGVTALSFWREALREKRRERFDILIQLAKKEGTESEEKTTNEIISFIGEYPGYIACSVLIKNEARKTKEASGIVISIVHYAIIYAYSLSPYMLGFTLIHRSQYSPTQIVIAVLGLIICLSANLILRLEPETT